MLTPRPGRDRSLGETWNVSSRAQQWGRPRKQGRWIEVSWAKLERHRALAPLRTLPIPGRFRSPGLVEG